ncbi:[protein-PII] uridylyltransferase [Desulfoferrobacter suflitae]|uniref:[protein-PII] uridylyltransferase n=1 Tax=Desulfoferrobacter suflitae TaxID=2865782 RepID=UPI0021644B98|nr:[protein-PII] uridylyltransferase [Desulfoferrobacter suflitae]MCK8604050.1 [protein-PII] uridylyltransferase [Desulfoferrobacter suflitae]
MSPKRFPALLRRLKEVRQTFVQTCRIDVPGLLAARTYTESFLDNLKRSFEEQVKSKAGWSLIAVGGFGRGELSHASDLDLLFLYRNRLPRVLEEIIQEFVYGLWDGGFEVGHATASLSAVKKMVREDFTILTNYLEAHFIAGDNALYADWRRAFLHDFGKQRRRKFLQDLAYYRGKRLLQYGESSYLLEPHVKEGVGGLRDLHIIRWAGMVYLHSSCFADMVEQGWLTSDEELWLEQAYDFLWRVRLQLHQLTGRRQDHLLFPEQEQVSARLGFLDGSQGSAVEAFMRLYYRHTARIRRTTSFFLERLEESNRKKLSLRLRRRVLPGPFMLEGLHLHFMEPEWIRKDPRLLMQFFWQAAQSDAHFHHQAGQVIRENLEFFTDPARTDAAVLDQFFHILLDPKQAFRVLKVMHETRFLDAFLPEFAGVRYRVQHDVYHLYTVDEHLLRTVRELHQMEQQPEESGLKLGLQEIFQTLTHRRVLFAAALLHDIGKGGGKGHALRGEKMARPIAERLGFSPQEADLLCFLIRNHLILVEIALKRDLMDEKPILRCAIEIADRERLNMLYLLTIADSRATGSGAWNTWKASLLRELFVKVDRQLRRGEWQRDDLQERSHKVQQEVLDLVVEEPEKQEILRWLETVSFRYLLSQKPQSIVQHYYLEKELSGSLLAMHTARSAGEMWQITIATRDRPGLFAIITGVLWARGLNILSADIFTRQTGIAMDVLIVERLPDPLRADELWRKVRDDLTRALDSRSHLNHLLSARRKPSLLQPKGLPRRKDRVVIDEEASDFYTIVEVYTWDRPGVLHSITNALFELGITIQLAKISTPGAQVADVFYVTDLYGNKLQEPEAHRAVRETLLAALAAIG